MSKVMLDLPPRKQFQEKCVAVFRPELRKNKIERASRRRVTHLVPQRRRAQDAQASVIKQHEFRKNVAFRHCL
ncbi:hypothetical protein FJW10_21065 [Mesorhizobium sp. B4-1-1]|nr:hypothetical protein FJW10_21065 [Mesorhizobium sp. B4-1-1]